MSKIAELQQTYQEICSEFDELYGGIEFTELDEDASNLLIKRLEAELKLKEVTIDTWKFNRYHKPVILHRISQVKNHIQNRKWLQTKKVET